MIKMFSILPSPTYLSITCHTNWKKFSKQFPKAQIDLYKLMIFFKPTVSHLEAGTNKCLTFF